MPDRTDTFYPAEDAIHGYGGQLMLGNGAVPEVFEAVAAVETITPGEMSTADIRRTHLRSPDAHHEHMPGLRDSGAFALRLIWLPEEESQSNAGGGAGAFQFGGLIAIWRARTTHNWKILLHRIVPGASPNAGNDVEWPFRGYVSRFQPGEIGAEDVIRAEAGIQPTEAYDAALP
jgi:hypothetical protein